MGSIHLGFLIVGNEGGTMLHALALSANKSQDCRLLRTMRSLDFRHIPLRKNVILI